MRRLILVALLLFSLLTCACGAGKEDLSAVLCGPFEAELAGEMCGLSFEACLTVGQADGQGVAPATLTFYAPRELSGTVLSRDAAGTVTLCYDNVAVGEAEGVGLLLFSLFPAASEIKGAALNEAGNTVVSFEGGEVELSPDGVPLAVKNADVSARVISWKKP